jgi:hypothetical protein
MKKILFVMMLGISFNGFAQKASYTGVIGDSNCGLKANNPDHAACAVKCVKGGAKPILVVENKIYQIDDPKKVNKFVGKKVTIEGTLDGETIKVEKIEEAAK